MKRLNLVLVVFTVITTMLVLQGCAVFLAARQPSKKDTSLFNIGTHRRALIAEFGAPIGTEEREGKKYEIFKFTQGYSTLAKVGRALFHATADFFTLFLWEIIGTPSEIVFSGKETAYEVSYDSNDCVDNIHELTKR